MTVESKNGIFKLINLLYKLYCVRVIERCTIRHAVTAQEGFAGIFEETAQISYLV